MNATRISSIKPILLFTGLYMALAIAGAIETGNREFIIYIGVMLVLIPAIYMVNSRYPLSAALRWALSIWGLLHMAGGLLPIPQSWFHHDSHPVLYNWWLIPSYLKYDQITHAYGFGITTWLCWYILKSALRSPGGSPVRPTPGNLVLCVAAGMGFGAFNEVVEFTATRILPDTNVGDYENTGWDLVANLAGSLIAALIIRCGDRQGGTNEKRGHTASRHISRAKSSTTFNEI